MTLLRFREYGSSEWTDISVDGELEEFAASLLAAALADNTSLHVQQRAEDTDWEDV